MAKKGKSRGSENWGHDQHASRLAQKIDRQNATKATPAEQQEQEQQSEGNGNGNGNGKTKAAAPKGYHRSKILSHDNFEKRQEGKLRLHISRTKRELTTLRTRLQAWDNVSEHASLKKLKLEEQKKRKREEEENAPGFVKKRKGRLGPETWKLRGPARPAWEVYDFDTRYVDPFIKAHQEALTKAKRCVNAFHVCKGSFGKHAADTDNNDNNDDDNSTDDDDDDNAGSSGNDKNANANAHSPLMIESCRKFLSLSMQYALLNLEAKKYKSARETLLEIVQLEGLQTLKPLTNARCRLMRMYLEANRPDSARRLWEKLPSNYASVWIRYSAALLEYVSWKILEEKGSSEGSAMELLKEAIRGNVYCAYYLAYHETFHQVMEYTEEVEDAEDGTLEQAIEYCHSDEMGNWAGTEGAVEWIRGCILESLNRKDGDDKDGDGDDDGDDEDTDDTDDTDDEEQTSCLTKKDVEWEENLATAEKKYEDMKMTMAASRDGDGSDQEQDEEQDQAPEQKEDQEEQGNEDASEVDLLMFTGMFRTGMDMLSDSGAFSL